MEVCIHSNLQTVQGEVTMEVDDEDRIDYLISTFCTQKNIRCKKQYVLRNVSDDILPNVRKLSSCGVKNGDILYLGLKTPSSTEWPCGCNQWWLLAVITLLIGAVGLVTVTLTMTEDDTLYDYGVVVDAGSSHTKLFVYQWVAGKVNGTAVAHQIHTCRSQGGGISNYTYDPEGAGRSLVPCLKEAQTKVPVASHFTTPIWLGATAGMRLLRESDNDTCNKILASVRAEMKKTSFSFPNPLSGARILDGWEEGVFSWITVNYLMGNFGQFATRLTLSQLWRQSPTTLGAMDMGGASTQMTFVAVDSRNTSSLRLYGQDYHVYTHSYLCYGFNEAFRMYRAHLVKMSKDSLAVISDPCMPKGDKDTLTYSDIFEVPCTMALAPNGTRSNKTYEFTGSGDPAACLAAVGKMFDFTCKHQSTPCSFNGVYQPVVHGDYIAFAGFYYLVAQLTGMGTNISYSQFRLAANYSCENGTSYEVVGELLSDDLENIQSGVCFMSQYAFTLLTEGYGFNESNWNSLHFQNSITTSQSTDLGWTLGLMLNASNAIPAELPSTSMNIVVYVLLLLLFVAFIILSVGFACRAHKTRSEVTPHRRLSTYGTM